MEEQNKEGGSHSASARDALFQGAQSQQSGHIACLPAEVLTAAFAYLLPESLAIDDETGVHEVESDKCLHDRRTQDDLIRITHVCRSWRNICLSTPSFWSLIWVTDEDGFASRTKKFVERSGNVPLEVAVRDECSRIQRDGTIGLINTAGAVPFNGPLLHPLSNFLGEFPHTLPRIKSLRICTRFPPGEDFSSCFDKPAPLLESFALYVNDQYSGNAPFQLPAPLFNGCTPSLKKLSLDYAEVPWTSSIFKNLTLLSLFKEIDTPESNRVELDVLLKIIENCPGLVSLELYFAGPVWPTNKHAAGVDAYQHLVTPSLKNIHLEGMTEMELVYVFLTCLQTTALKDLKVGHFGLSFRSIDVFLPQTLAFDPRIDLCNCIKMDVDHRCEWVFIDQFQVEDLEDKMVQDPRYFSLRWLRETKSSFRRRMRVSNDDESHLGPDFEGDPDDYRMLAMSFLRRMCPSPERIRALEIRGSDDVIMEFPFEEVFGYLTNLYCVEIRFNLGYVWAGWFMNFLHSEAYAKKDTPEVALPSVHMLIFDSVEFIPDYFKALCDFLRHRKNRKSPISYVGINYCKGIGKKRLSTIKRFVKSVDVVNDDLFDKYGEEMDLPESGYYRDEE